MLVALQGRQRNRHHGGGLFCRGTALGGRRVGALDRGVIGHTLRFACLRPGGHRAADGGLVDANKHSARYRDHGDGQIPRALVDQAEALYLELCTSQRRPRLLHGDLQHYNVLYDHVRGWVAIDPKGVVGELEYEIGASLRNPIEAPALFTSATVVRARIDRLCGALALDSRRALAWSFAQAVLSAIWSVEDGFVVRASDPVLVLARTLRRMLDLHR